MKHANGFTLIELMIVVALIAVIASIAIPAYGDYVIRGKLVEASTQLADGRVKQEQYFQDSRTYVGGPCPAETKYFTYDCETPARTSTTYTLTAANKANQGLGAAGAYTYTINELNTKATVTFAGVAQNQVAPATCWLMKKGDTC